MHRNLIKKPWAYNPKIVGFLNKGPRFLNQVPTLPCVKLKPVGVMVAAEKEGFLPSAVLLQGDIVFLFSWR